MSERVVDSSIVTAAIRLENRPDDLVEVLDGAILSAVNAAEIYTKLTELGLDENDTPIAAVMSLLGRVEPFTHAQAHTAGRLRSATRHAGLSLGDRACLALAMELHAVAYTTDRAWGRVETGCHIAVIG